MTKTEEFKSWLKENEEHLKSYSMSELVNIAIAAGFDKQTVVQYVTHLRFANESAA